MLNSQVLEVGIGLVLCFLLVSLVLTACRETIETWMRTRTLDLELALAELLHDRKGTGLRKDLLDHPLIRGLYPGDYKGTVFNESGNALNENGKPLGTFTRGDASNKPTYIPARQVALALIDLAETERIDADNPVAGALASMNKAVSGDFERLKGDVEAWYNDAMERATGRYRRRTQWILLWLGLGVALTLNVNAVVIAQALSTNPILSAAVSDAATEYVATRSTTGTTDADAAARSADVEKLQAIAKELELPIGWNGESWKNLVMNPIRAGQYFDVALLVAGYLITGLAATLGAPFWFDVLSKLTTIRSTVKPKPIPADSAETSPAPSGHAGGAGTGSAGTSATATPGRAQTSGVILNPGREHIYG